MDKIFVKPNELLDNAPRPLDKDNTMKIFTLGMRFGGVFYNEANQVVGNYVIPPRTIAIAIEKFQSLIERREAYGCITNDSPELLISNIAFTVDKIFCENSKGYNKYIAYCTTLPTPNGAMLERLIRESQKIRLIPHGYGSIINNKYVKDDYTMICLNVTMMGE